MVRMNDGMKRINVKGRYRVVERNEKGQFTSVKKWHSQAPPKSFNCDNDNCGEKTSNRKGYAIAIVGRPVLELCSKCFKKRGSLLKEQE